MQAGIEVVAGVDNEVKVGYAYETNNRGARFVCRDVRYLEGGEVADLFGGSRWRVLVGCAPCAPFSDLANFNGEPRSSGRADLVNEFARVVSAVLPDVVLMENVPGLALRGRVVFERFVTKLERSGYVVDWRVVNCADYGVPQRRRRLILLGSRLGRVVVPSGRFVGRAQWRTVREAIGHLRPLRAGEADPHDPLHSAGRCSELTLLRLRMTPKDGGSRAEWPRWLDADYRGRRDRWWWRLQYARLWWDRPAPTITSELGLYAGRRAHPEQDRGITLREAALLQTFPASYVFWPEGVRMNRVAVARMIANAVPCALARELGEAIMRHVREAG